MFSISMKFYCSENNSFTSRSACSSGAGKISIERFYGSKQKCSCQGTYMRWQCEKLRTKLNIAMWSYIFWRYCLKLWHGGQRNSEKETAKLWSALQKVLVGTFDDNSTRLLNLLWIKSARFCFFSKEFIYIVMVLLRINPWRFLFTQK